MDLTKVWNFFRRETDKELQKRMEDHLAQILIATSSLEKVVEAWQEKDLPKLDQEVSKINEAENAGDRILSEIWLDFAKGSLKSKLQSNIINFITEADDVINHTKRAVNNFLIIQNLELPQEIYETIKKECQLLHQCVEKLSEGLAIYREDIKKIIDLAAEISSLEHQIDGIYTQLKTLYFDLHKFAGNVPLLVIFDHAMRDLEKATNSAEDAADILHSIVLGTV
jgi:predicted phosphate transport protein (TIGR00153 family)